MKISMKNYEKHTRYRTYMVHKNFLEKYFTYYLLSIEYMYTNTTLSTVSFD